ncbi:MAG: fibro-slime domain-containing protein [Chitinivibrionales bacterium]|nr:fibro-slime domain-containing protein [Chitinivibrionales bacterium]
MKKSMILRASIVLTMALISIVSGQGFPDSIRVPVTFYDFHSDGTCPDFNPVDSKDTVTKGMVQESLDPTGRPVRGRRVYFSHFLETWFRSSDEQSDTTKKKKPVYTKSGSVDSPTHGTLSKIDAATTNLYDNKKITDSLTFVHKGNGMYEFARREFFPLDGKGFGNEQTTNWNGSPINRHNFSFTMMMERKFIYRPEKKMTFRFRGDDDVWVFVNNKLALDIGGIHQAVADSFDLNALATTLNLQPNKMYTMSFFYAERQADSSVIRVTTDLIYTVDSLRLKVFPKDTIAAGDTATVVAQIISDTGIVKNFQGTISWGFADLKGLNLKDSTFHPKFDSSVFVPTKAPTTVKVWATAVEATTGKVLDDTVLIYVIVGPPKYLYLEQTNDPVNFPFTPNLFFNNTISILANETTKKAYAILRDKMNIYIGPSKQTDWKMVNTAIASVASGIADQGEGVITRITTGETEVTATDRPTSLTGTAKVRIDDYYYTAIDIYVKTPAVTSIEHLLMNTNQDTVLHVRGQRSDTKAWEDVPGCNWSISPTLKTTTKPTFQQNWKVEPVDTGNGLITVWLNNARDSITATFTAGPPTSVLLEFTTPEIERIAGKPITTRITIRNNDNMLIPGVWTGESMFKDLLENIPIIKNLKGTIMYQSMIIGTDTVPFERKSNLTFTNGVSICYTLLYWVPTNGKLHDIKIALLDIQNQTSMTDHKTTVLFPGPVARIAIIPHDTTILTIGEGRTFKTHGWDEYSNYLGEVPSDWFVDTSLPQQNSNGNIQFYYSPTITNDGEGYLHAKASQNATARDSVYVIVNGPGAKVLNAKTQDLSGNGYLDGILINFDRAVIIPKNFNLGGILLVATWADKFGFPQQTQFNVVATTPQLGTASTEWLLNLREVKTDVPQTNWTPSMTFSDTLPEVQRIVNLRCNDGAGAVVWKVVKKVNDIYDSRKDVVTVFLSENFKINGVTDFNQESPAPTLVFNVWYRKNATDTVMSLETLPLKDISSSTRPDTNYYTVFKMVNGFTLTTKHYFNIKQENGYIVDLVKNKPNENNQKVPVTIEGGMGKIIIAPVPIIPSLNTHSLIQSKQLIHINPTDAIKIITQNGGAIITIELIIHIDKNGIKTGGRYNAQASLQIYDAAGNLVHKRENRKNVIPVEMWNNKINNMSDSTSIQTLCFYWDGITDRGMKSAPGIYNVFVFITYNNEKKQYSRIVAVGRK